MEKNKIFIITAVVVLLILVSAFIIISKTGNQYKFEAEDKGVRFVSNYKNPADAFAEFSKMGSFVVSPSFIENSSGNGKMGEAQLLISTVLVTEGKKTTQTVRSLDSQGNISYCVTNDANVHVNRQIDKTECAALLMPDGIVVFLIQQPNPSLLKPEIEIKEGLVEIRPRTYDEAPDVAFLAISTMYSDSKQIVEGVNALINKVKV
jgi:hypothetical protein